MTDVLATVARFLGDFVPKMTAFVGVCVLTVAVVGIVARVTCFRDASEGDTSQGAKKGRPGPERRKAVA